MFPQNDVSNYQSARFIMRKTTTYQSCRLRQYVAPKRWFQSIRLHGVTEQVGSSGNHSNLCSKSLQFLSRKGRRLVRLFTQSLQEETRILS
jgi:hypothetical protein